MKVFFEGKSILETLINRCLNETSCLFVKKGMVRLLEVQSQVLPFVSRWTGAFRIEGLSSPSEAGGRRWNTHHCSV